MRFAALVTVAALALSACVSDDAMGPAEKPASNVASSPDALTAWEAWKADENAAWSSNKFAILKIDDAVYLSEGETAWLGARKQKMLEHKWTLGVPRGSHFTITYKDGKAKVVNPSAGTNEAFALDKMQSVNLSDGVDVRFGLTQTSPGVNGLRVMVYNQGHPLAKAFHGLEHFSYNPNAVVEATFEASPSVEGVDFQTSRGWLKRINRVGYASFTLMGKPVKLGMYSDETDPKQVKQLSAFFLDELSGKETYGVGRYIDIDVNGLPARLTLDFNRAYNPNCARSPHYNCPLAIDKIPVALRAGEKIPPKH